MAGKLSTPLEFVKGIGPQRAQLLKDELALHTIADLLQHYPFRHEDRTRIMPIGGLPLIEQNVLVAGRLSPFEQHGSGRGARLVAQLSDGIGHMELVWFHGIQWVLKRIQPGMQYLVYGRTSIYNSRISILHPEIEPLVNPATQSGYLAPVYTLTEKLKRKFIESKQIASFVRTALEVAGDELVETLPDYINENYAFVGKKQAMHSIHLPENKAALDKALARLKFEELFYTQLRLLYQQHERKETFPGIALPETGLVKQFSSQHLPFPLTNAQRRVLREILNDVNTGKQMNRLLQGDVGSGKTIVAFITMLMALSNGYQACLMAPTEILAEQHMRSLEPLAAAMNLNISLLTGSSKSKHRKQVLENLANGSLHMIVGTHALLENQVAFARLGVAIVDEQHRFGVAQRARLWQKGPREVPHVLVMTATPIPRTLAMTIYGDLDVSVIDELPPGRKPIQTLHRFDQARPKINQFMRDEIAKGRQVYVVYPLIEESEKLDYANLTEGFERIVAEFPPPRYQVAMVHGRQKQEERDAEMKRFLTGEANILVATTVIEVGVNVPNASIMIIESAERFGLSQLHQLRGRVGRGAEQSYCILMTGHKLGKDSRFRLNIMCETNDGFRIAEADLKLRGPGEMTGTRQSGVLDLLLADLATDQALLSEARKAARYVLEKDPNLSAPVHAPILRHLNHINRNSHNWSRIS